MIADHTLTILQSIAPDMTTGSAIFQAGIFLAVTLVVSRARSAAGVVSWALSGGMLVLALMGIIPSEVYFLSLIITMLAIGATVGYNRT